MLFAVVPAGPALMARARIPGIIGLLLGGRLIGPHGRDRTGVGAMFALTAPQAAATLAATVVGFEIGLFSTTVVNAVLVLILVSIVVASVLAPRFIKGVSAAGLVPRMWHTRGIARTRVSTTVDADLLDTARRLCAGLNDAALFDEALAALRARHRAAAIDDAYAAYDDRPLDDADEWGDLATFRAAAASS